MPTVRELMESIPAVIPANGSLKETVAWMHARDHSWALVLDEEDGTPLGILGVRHLFEELGNVPGAIPFATFPFGTKRCTLDGHEERITAGELACDRNRDLFSCRLHGYQCHCEPV